MKAELSTSLPHPQPPSPAWPTALLAAFCVLLGSAHTAFGWGAQGHRVIAQIAYNHLDSSVKDKCDALILATPTCGTTSGEGFVNASTWADSNRTCQNSSSWHYIDIPFSLDGTPTNGVAPTPNVATAINASIATLTNSGSAQADQATALRFLIHFVGDITQPCHSSEAFFLGETGGDNGGNYFYINGTWNNLHSLWDAGGGYLTDGLTVAQKAAAVETDYPYTPNPGTIPNPMDWAYECYPIAVTNAYVGITQDTTPTPTYLTRAKATTEQRMAVGGHRLADLLNTIFGSKAPATVTLSPLAQTYNGTARSVTATTSPAGLAVSVTYNGSANAPINAGSYTVIGTINDPNYLGSATNTLVVSKAAGTVTLGNLAQTYTGTARTASATTTPASLAVNLTYNGSANAPINAGSYTVVGTINDQNYQGSATDTLVVSPAAGTVALGNLAQTYNGTARNVSATTTPPGLAVNLTYNGSASAPIDAGSYTAVGTISDQNYQGSATNILVIGKAAAVVTLEDLSYTYDGTAKSVSVTTSPSSLATQVTYDGSLDAPTNTGSYTVVATVNDLNYQGSATNTLVINQVPSIKLYGSAMLPGTGFGFDFTNLPSLSFTILSGTNPAQPFDTWTVAGSATEVSPGHYHFSDPQATSNPCLLYRVRSP